MERSLTLIMVALDSGQSDVCAALIEPYAVTGFLSVRV